MSVAGLLPLALFAALGGVVACLAGAAGLSELRRLGGAGVSVQALVKRRPGDAARPMLQFLTEDGRVVEVFSPVPPGRRQPLADGARVWVTYDPGDPRVLVVRGRERRWLEYVFLGLGTLAVTTAFVLLTIAV